jgi:hypothetical protein
MLRPMNNIASTREDEDGEHSFEDSSDNTISENHTSSASVQEGPSGLGDDNTFVQVETVAVNRSKCMVYVALLCAAAAVSSVTYFFLSKEEENSLKIEVSLDIW